MVKSGETERRRKVGLAIMIHRAKSTEKLGWHFLSGQQWKDSLPGLHLFPHPTSDFFRVPTHHRPQNWKGPHDWLKHVEPFDRSRFFVWKKHLTLVFLD